MLIIMFNVLTGKRKYTFFMLHRVIQLYMEKNVYSHPRLPHYIKILISLPPTY